MVNKQKLTFSWQCGQCVMSTLQKFHQVNNRQKLPWPFWLSFGDFKLNVCSSKRQRNEREKHWNILWLCTMRFRFWKHMDWVLDSMQSPKLLPLWFQGLWIISEHLPCCSKTNMPLSIKKVKMLCFSTGSTPRHLLSIVLFTEMLRFHKSC